MADRFPVPERPGFIIRILAVRGIVNMSLKHTVRTILLLLLFYLLFLLLLPAHDNNSFVGDSGKMQLYHFGPFCTKPLACVFTILKTTITNMQSLVSNITITTCYT